MLVGEGTDNWGSGRLSYTAKFIYSFGFDGFQELEAHPVVDEG